MLSHFFLQIESCWSKKVPGKGPEEFQELAGFWMLYTSTLNTIQMIQLGPPKFEIVLSSGWETEKLLNPPRGRQAQQIVFRS